MEKVNKFIEDYTYHCSNENTDGTYTPWMSIDDVRRAVEIAVDEATENVIL